MNHRALIVLSALFVTVIAQRSPYAGRRPVGYPDFDPTTTTTTTTQSNLGNRFGNENATSVPPTTTQRLPIEARGDADLVRRLSKLPVDQQPFWLINWQHYETNRQNPQTYELKPNLFIESAVNNQFLSNPPNGQDFRAVNSQISQRTGAGNLQNEPTLGLGNSQNVQNFQPFNSQNGQNSRFVTPQGQDFRAVSSQNSQRTGAGNFQNEPTLGLGNPQNVQNFKPFNSQNGQNAPFVTPQGQNFRANSQNGQQLRVFNSQNGNDFRAVDSQEGTIDQFLPSKTNVFFR